MFGPPGDASLHDVTDCVFVRGYTLHLRFDDDTERTIDFEPVLCLFSAHCVTCCCSARSG